MRVNIRNKQLFSDVVKKIFPGIDLPEINGLTIDSRKVKRGDSLNIFTFASDK